jgi:hypothetical protein
MKPALLLLAVGLLLSGCGAAPHGTVTRGPDSAGQRAGIPRSLLESVRPIGRGARFQPDAGSHVIGVCRPMLGRRLRAHVELFGADRVVLLAAGIGTRAPRRIRDGQVAHAGCFGALVTLDPTGTVYFRPGSRPTLGDLFRAWGQALGGARIASFTGGRVRVYVNGQPHRGAPQTVRLTNGAEIVLEVGPHVPPHARYSFAPLPSPDLR